jgi:mannose-6-phosphate isomerase-like protein (cupin superfamily)
VSFTHRHLPGVPDAIAPDGAHVRVLVRVDGGSMAHFTLPPGGVAHAVTHLTVEEVWFVTSGRGEMWRRDGDREEVVDLVPGLSLTIPLGTHFQFRSIDDQPLTAVAVTMPPWPGHDEAYRVAGPWEPTLEAD